MTSRIATQQQQHHQGDSVNQGCQQNNTMWLTIPKATWIPPLATTMTGSNHSPVGTRSNNHNNNNCSGELSRLLQKYPIPSLSRLEYGTAGFRYDADILPPVMVRVGIFCAIYRKHFMVTASHNDESYNGVKLCNADGSMLSTTDEQILTELVNFNTTEQVLTWILQQQQQHHHYHTTTTTTTTTTTHNDDTKDQDDDENGNHNGIVVLHTGRDTRSHSPSLQHLAILAAQHTIDRVAIMNHGIVTTPMLHHVVLHANAVHQLPLLSMMIPLRPFLAGYYDILVQSYLALLHTVTVHHKHQQPHSFHSPLLVDCACGVGYEHVLRLNAMIQDKCGIHWDDDNLNDISGKSCCMSRPRVFIATNGPDHGPLNQDCGSEHVQKQRSLPKFYDNHGVGVVVTNDSSTLSIPYACALDGDADRIVFFSYNHDELVLLDGDKISCLIAKFIREQFAMIQQVISSELNLPTLGVVQTAYANGSSTQYLKSVLPSEDNVLLAKTGVKYVHHKAVKYCDVGVYFEANGHGTVVFGSNYFLFLQHAEKLLKESLLGDTTNRSTNGPNTSTTTAASVALRRLQLLPSLINQAVGDALSDLLLVDFILTYYQWTLQDWNQAMYTDLPSVQTKVQVPDRNVIVTNDTETRCLEPPELQQGLDQAMTEMDDVAARCFVRPSGTENVVRIYAEATTLNGAQALAQRALEVIQKATTTQLQQSKM